MSFFQFVSHSPVTMTSEVDPAVLNRFTLEERVGKGAYGVVFKVSLRMSVVGI